MGYLRDFVTAAFLGAGSIADAFFIAFKIPNMFRAIFAEGAFNSAFVPMFSHALEEKGEAKAKKFAANIFAFLFYILLGTTLLALVFMPLIIGVFAPGFRAEPEKFALTVSLSRITFPFLMLVALASFFGAVLNSLGRFKPYAAAPIILNLTIIASALTLSGMFPNAAWALAIGVSLSGVIQLAMLWYFASRRGFGKVSLKPEKNKDSAGFFARLGPGVVSAGVYHLNVLIGSIFATATDGAISYIYYADRLNQLPVGVIGVAAATVMLPSLSKDVRGGRGESACNRLNDSLVLSSLLVIPSAIGLFMLAEPIVRLVFQYGAFTAADTFEVARVLKILALSLPALVYIKMFANLFYARGDTKTPMRLSMFALVLNVTFIVLFSRILGWIGIVVALSVNNWAMFSMLAASAFRRGYTGLRVACGRFARIAAASAVMGAVLWFIAPRAEGFFSLGFVGAASAAVYTAALWAMNYVALPTFRR
jgi:putative peptidoglycan lipid II flippase